MGVLEKLLQKDKDIAVVMAIDLLIAGVDTVSTIYVDANLPKIKLLL